MEINYVNKARQVLERISTVENQMFSSKKINCCNPAQLIIVTKNIQLNSFEPLILAGFNNFAENKVQEAKSKWQSQIGKVKLHMVGHLQSNKARDAVKIFDVIHTLDNLKLAQKLKQSEDELGLKRTYFIQVNVANEQQKFGIPQEKLEDFYKDCLSLKLNITGLMCIPPKNQDPIIYFTQLKQLANKLGLENLSMGMSADFEAAILCGATHVRIGSKIFND